MWVNSDHDEPRTKIGCKEHRLMQIQRGVQASCEYKKVPGAWLQQVQISDEILYIFSAIGMVLGLGHLRLLALAKGNAFFAAQAPGIMGEIICSLSYLHSSLRVQDDLLVK